MRNKKILPLILAVALTSCVMTTPITTTKIELEDQVLHDTITNGDSELKFTKFEKISKDNQKIVNNPEYAWIKKDLQAGKDIYLLEYSLVHNSKPINCDLVFNLVTKGKTSVASTSILDSNASQENGSVYFSVDSGTPIEAIITTLIVDGNEIEVESTISPADIQANNSEVKVNEEVKETIELAPEVAVNIYDYGTIDEEMMTTNEKSNLSQYLINPDDKIYRLAYNITDKRGSLRPISREDTGDGSDIITPLITLKEGGKLSPISIFSDLTSTNGNYEISEYYLIKDASDIESIKFKGTIDGADIQEKEIKLDNTKKRLLQINS